MITVKCCSVPVNDQNVCHVETFVWAFLLFNERSVVQALAENAAIGLLITVVVSVPIVIFSTMNIIVGMLCAINIILVVLAVIAMIPIVGWKVGVSVLAVVLTLLIDVVY